MCPKLSSQKSSRRWPSWSNRNRNSFDPHHGAFTLRAAGRVLRELLIIHEGGNLISAIFAYQ